MHNQGSFPADKDDKKPVFVDPYNQDELTPVNNGHVPAQPVVPASPGVPTPPTPPASPVYPVAPAQPTLPAPPTLPVPPAPPTLPAPPASPVSPAPHTAPAPPAMQPDVTSNIFNPPGNYTTPGASSEAQVNAEYPVTADYQAGGVMAGNGSSFGAGAYGNAEPVGLQPESSVFPPSQQKPKKKTKMLVWGGIILAAVAVIVVVCVLVSAIGNRATSNHADVQPAKSDSQTNNPQPSAPAPEKKPADSTAVRFCSAYKVKRLEYDKLMEEYKLRAEANPSSVEERKRNSAEIYEILTKAGQIFKDIAVDSNPETKKVLLEAADRIDSFVRIPLEQLADNQSPKLVEELVEKINKADAALDHDVLNCL